MEYYKNLKTERSQYLKNYLIKNYSTKTKEDITKELNLSWNYIQKISHLFGIKREFNDSPRTLIKLLNFDYISCYWLGFLLADAHISKSYAFNVNLNIKDEIYFQQIQNHLTLVLKPSYVKKLNAVRYILSDKQTIIKIKEIFNWKTNKTKNIPIIPKLLDDNQLFSLIIGFIDGDGSINKNGSTLKVKCDANWKNILEMFYFHLTKENKIFKLTSDNCSIIQIGGWKNLNEIKNKAIQLKLPIMERKWNRLNNNRWQITENKRKKIHELLNKNMKYREIKELTGCSSGFINKIKYED